jgi:hypothetical protein
MARHAGVLWLAALLIAAGPATSVAGPASSGADPAPEVAVLPYSGDLIIADTLSLSLLAVGIATESGAIGVLGALAYVAIPPALHWRRGRRSTGLASAGLRLALPLSGFVVGASSFNRCYDDPDPRCGVPQMVIALGLGVALATTLDAAILARPDPPTGWRAVSLSPLPLPGGGGLAIAGGF